MHRIHNTHSVMCRNQLLSFVENISNTLHVIISGSSEMLLDLITYAPPPIPALFLPVSNIGKQSWPESDIFPALRERGGEIRYIFLIFIPAAKYYPVI
jgi:hypothetical protein